MEPPLRYKHTWGCKKPPGFGGKSYSNILQYLRKCQALVSTATCSMIALLTSGTVVGREHAGERKEAGSTSIKYFIMFLITVTGKFISTMYWRCHREGWLACGSHDQSLRVHCRAHHCAGYRGQGGGGYSDRRS